MPPPASKVSARTMCARKVRGEHKMTPDHDDDIQASRAPEADAAADRHGPEEAEAAPDLPAQLKRAEMEAGEFRDAWLRAKAETDNARRLAQNDVAKAHKYAVERFAQELLGVKD